MPHKETQGTLLLKFVPTKSAVQIKISVFHYFCSYMYTRMSILSSADYKVVAMQSAIWP